MTGSYPGIISLSRAQEISWQYLLLRTVILQEKSRWLLFQEDSVTISKLLSLYQLFWLLSCDSQVSLNFTSGFQAHYGVQRSINMINQTYRWSYFGLPRLHMLRFSRTSRVLCLLFWYFLCVVD